MAPQVPRGCQRQALFACSTRNTWPNQPHARHHHGSLNVTGERDLVFRAIEPLLTPGSRITTEQKGERTWRVRVDTPAAAYVVKLFRSNSFGFGREVHA